MTPDNSEVSISVREFFDSLLSERDRRYEDRFRSSEAQRHAEIEAIRSSSEFLVSTFKEAMEKSEKMQQQYNESHNGLIRKMEDQYQHMMPREEALRELGNLKDQIVDLRESRSASEGKSSGATGLWTIIVGVLLLIATMVHLAMSLMQSGIVK